MNYDEWAEAVQQDVYENWKENHEDWEHGVKIFYSPVHDETDLLILGFQPGGDASSFQGLREQFENNDFSTPENHHYVDRGWSLAEEMRVLFDGYEQILSDSVASNVVFFRSPDTSEWDTLPYDRRTSMENFCWNYVEELINRVDPSAVLAIGIRTFDEVTGRLGTDTEVLEKRGQDRLVASSTGSTPRVVGTMHLTGARIANEDRKRLHQETRKLLEEEIDRL